MDIHKINTGFQPIVVVSKKNNATKVKKDKNKIKILKTENSPRKHYRKSKSSSDHVKRKSDPQNIKISQNLISQHTTSQNNFPKTNNFRSTSISNSYTSSDPDSELHFPSPPTSQIIDSSDESVIVMSKLTKPSKTLQNAHSKQKHRNCASILLALGVTCLVIGLIEKSTNLLGIVDILEIHRLQKRDLNWNREHRNGISDFIARNRNPEEFARINHKSALEKSISNVQKDQKWVGKINNDFKKVNFTQIALENIKVNEAKGPFINEVDKLVDERKRAGEKYVKKAEIFKDNFVIRVKPKVRKNRPPPPSLMKK